MLLQLVRHKMPKGMDKKETTEAELKDYAVKKYEERASERENGDDDNNSVVCLLTEFSRSIFGWLHNYTQLDSTEFNKAKSPVPRHNIDYQNQKLFISFPKTNFIKLNSGASEREREQTKERKLKRNLIT